MADAWAQTALGAICRFQAGDAFGLDDQGRTVGDHPFIKVSDMNLVGNEIYISRANNWISDEQAHHYRLHPKNAVIFAKIGIALTYNRRRRLVRPTALDNNMMSAVPASQVDPVWFYYLLSTIDFNLISSGSALPYLTVKDLSKIQIDLPTKREQEAIANVLGALDDKIELNRRMNETLEATARAIFKDWFVDFGPTRAKMDGRVRYLAADIWSLFPDRLDDKGKPEGWELRPVGDFAELRGGKQLEKERITSVGTIPVFGGAGFMGFTEKHNAEGFVISVGRVGAYCGQFFSHRGKAWINNNASLISQFQGVSGEWLFQSLRHADIEIIKKGAAQPFVSNTDVGNMLIVWPGENTVSNFKDIIVPLMLKIEQNDTEASTLAATRDLLLPKLMSGEVRVSDATALV
ncbi:restriction endonuclease subunit S [Falsiroseomonas tokyonensis]|uniref:Restriction endonuclease subunit S n=1 Tax=Falsiroseomonas tokyonensis TaxID=430521 RepID=A0ABV7BSB3_9PROT|nr:restriction endonuclease subunit S [Falsiroseomonas tokyonensis]MBU8537396.1 restriction endonuclease subunit S [Falsiroseomonas tokyonensis]